MAAKTRADLVAEVARRCGRYYRRTATGGSTTTLEDTTGLLAPDDYWVGHFLYIVTDAGGGGAAPEGEERPVTDYVQATATLTVDPAFTVAPGSGDTYELLPARRSEVEAAINAGIRAAGETWLVMKVDDSTVSLADDDYDYNLPSDLARLLAVLVRGGSDEPWVALDGRLYSVSKTPGGQELVFDREIDSDYTVRLEYLARVSEMSTDAATLGLGEPAEREMVAFVVEWALFWLHDQAAGAAPTAAEFRAHFTQGAQYREVAEAIRKRAAPFHTRGTARFERWARGRG